VSQPPKYAPSHAFMSDAATLSGFPGQSLDIEFNAIAAVTKAIEANLALIQRDDGALANGSVSKIRQDSLPRTCFSQARRRFSEITR
jgi:hypothetical protein